MRCVGVPRLQHGYAGCSAREVGDDSNRIHRAPHVGVAACPQPRMQAHAWRRAACLSLLGISCSGHTLSRLESIPVQDIQGTRLPSCAAATRSSVRIAPATRPLLQSPAISSLARAAEDDLRPAAVLVTRTWVGSSTGIGDKFLPTLAQLTSKNTLNGVLNGWVSLLTLCFAGLMTLRYGAFGFGVDVARGFRRARLCQQGSRLSPFLKRS